MMSFVTKIWKHGSLLWLITWVISPSSNRFVWARIRCIHIQFALRKWDLRQWRHDCSSLWPTIPFSNHIHDSSPNACCSPRRHSGQIITHHLKWYYIQDFFFWNNSFMVCFLMLSWCLDYLLSTYQPTLVCTGVDLVSISIDTIWVSIIRISHFLILVGYG